MMMPNSIKKAIHTVFQSSKQFISNHCMLFHQRELFIIQLPRFILNRIRYANFANIMHQTDITNSVHIFLRKTIFIRNRFCQNSGFFTVYIDITEIFPVRIIGFKISSDISAAASCGASSPRWALSPS